MSRSVVHKPIARIAAIAAAAVLAACVIVLGGCAAPEINGAETLNASFEANAGTGYEWTCTIDDEQIVEVTDTAITAENVKSDEPISGGPQNYSFTLAIPENGVDGKTTVTFTFARSWEETPDDITVTWEVESKDGLLTIGEYTGPDDLKDALTVPEDW